MQVCEKSMAACAAPLDGDLLMKAPRRLKASSFRLDRSEGFRGIHEICWACHGTGVRFVSVSPLVFRRCFMCNGDCGRRARATDHMPALSGMAA